MLPMTSPYLEYSHTGEEPPVIRVKGHRIDLIHSVELFQQGLSAEAISQYFGGLDVAIVQGIIDYYIQHREDVEGYIAATNAAAEKRHQDTLTHLAQERLEGLLRRKHPA